MFRAGSYERGGEDPGPPNMVENRREAAGVPLIGTPDTLSASCPVNELGGWVDVGDMASRSSVKVESATDDTRR